jgi:selenocysteine lyase/cysteine desulfurase
MNFETRAGCSCAGPYGHDLLGLEVVAENDKPGWVRISIHFSHTQDEIYKITEAIKSIYESYK